MMSYQWLWIIHWLADCVCIQTDLRSEMQASTGRTMDRSKRKSTLMTPDPYHIPGSVNQVNCSNPKAGISVITEHVFLCADIVATVHSSSIKSERHLDGLLLISSRLPKWRVRVNYFCRTSFPSRLRPETTGGRRSLHGRWNLETRSWTIIWCRAILVREDRLILQCTCEQGNSVLLRLTSSSCVNFTRHPDGLVWLSRYSRQP